MRSVRGGCESSDRRVTEFAPPRGWIAAPKSTADLEEAIENFMQAIDAAYSQAEADHQAGVCHLSEWSCSYCEKGAGR